MLSGLLSSLLFKSFRKKFGDAYAYEAAVSRDRKWHGWLQTV